MNHASAQSLQNVIVDPVFCRRENETHDIFRLSLDPASRLIRAFASGTWSFEETNSYIGKLAALVRLQRSICGIARVLLDRREVTTQSADVADLLAKANGVIFHCDDKIALVVSSSLAKTSLRQRMPHPGSKAFLSIDAAETWLGAFALPQGSRHP